jgi:hypothetical protein
MTQTILTELANSDMTLPEFRVLQAELTLLIYRRFYEPKERRQDVDMEINLSGLDK